MYRAKGKNNKVSPELTVDTRSSTNAQATEGNFLKTVFTMLWDAAVASDTPAHSPTASVATNAAVASAPVSPTSSEGSSTTEEDRAALQNAMSSVRF